MPQPPNPALIHALTECLGPEHVLTGARLSLRDPGWCAGSQGAGLMVRPADAGELAEICKIAAQHAAPIVAHGGLTGLVEGTHSVPGQVIVSFERMDQITRIDPAQGLVELGAGVRLEALDAVLEPHGLMLGVDIAARGSCTLGGMVATNAGGVRVLRHGMMRAQVLGLEVVTAAGAVLDLMCPLIKSNAGYDLKHVFIGSEGTLGLITRMVLRVVPRPGGTASAMVALPDAGALAHLLPQLRTGLGDHLTALEAMWPGYLDMLSSCPGHQRRVLPHGAALYVIVEASERDEPQARARLETVLAACFEAGHITDAVIAQSEAERAAIWRAREDSGAIDAAFDVALSYDVGLQLADMQAYVARIEAGAQILGKEAFVFGHLADGNLHVMFGLDHGENREPFDALVYDSLRDFTGTTISAEHGIGLEKRDWLARQAPPEVLAAMRTLKQAFDPMNRLNPGKVLATDRFG